MLSQRYEKYIRNKFLVIFFASFIGLYTELHKRPVSQQFKERSSYITLISSFANRHPLYSMVLPLVFGSCGLPQPIVVLLG